MRHVGSFKGEVFLFSGQVKGKTLLPLPPQADMMVKAVECEERLIFCRVIIDVYACTCV